MFNKKLLDVRAQEVNKPLFPIILIVNFPVVFLFSFFLETRSTGHGPQWSRLN